MSSVSPSFRAVWITRSYPVFSATSTAKAFIDMANPFTIDDVPPLPSIQKLSAG